MKDSSESSDDAFNIGVDCIEAMVLAHFCDGVDVSGGLYIKGVETVYESLCNNVVEGSGEFCEAMSADG